jgi:hypothetical protein
MINVLTIVKMRTVTLSYVKSLLLIALAASVFLGISIIVQTVFVDFVHGNPHRTQGNAIFMMLVYPPLFAVIAVIGVGLVFGFSQLFQIVLVNGFVKRYGPIGHLVVLLALPVTTIITWYGYEYLTPTDFNLGINTPSDWRPYQHGLTSSRYLLTLAFQAAVTIFSVLYFEATLRKGFEKLLIAVVLIVAVALGCVQGHAMATKQYKFVDAQ